MLKHINQEGRYDERGRRLDPVPLPPADWVAPAPVAATAQAVQQSIYLTADATKANDYVASNTIYVLRATWTAPRIADYEYVYLYDNIAPGIGEDAGSDYYTWAPARYDGGGSEQEASYLFLASGPQTSLERLGHFWAAYVRYVDGAYKVVARSPFRAGQPNWMANVLRDKPQWGTLTLNRIFIPGSHDTGTFDMVDRGIPNVYNQTQTMNFVQQLHAGVRWLDIRMGYYSRWEKGSEGPFFTVHAAYASWSAWSTALTGIAGWLASNPTEIVFINFKWEGAEAWTDALRTRVLQMTYDALQAHGVLESARRTSATVNQMVQDRKRIVLSAADLPPAMQTYVGSAIDYDWFDKYYVAALIADLENHLGDPRSWMWASGTVLTPHKYDGTIPWGVYSLTMDAIDRLNRWIRVNASKLNVVSVDFIESSVALALVEEFNKALV